MGRVGWRWALLLSLTAPLACGGRATDVPPAAKSAAARGFAGTWSVSFQMDPHSTIATRGGSAILTGTVAFIVVKERLPDTDELSDITHAGVYDIDFRSFGWAAREGPPPPGAVARVVPAPPASGIADSAYIVLSPGQRLLTVRMSGAIHGDSVSGSWTTDAFRAGGSTGRFVMWRDGPGS